MAAPVTIDAALLLVGIEPTPSLVARYQHDTVVHALVKAVHLLAQPAPTVTSPGAVITVPPTWQVQQGVTVTWPDGTVRQYRLVPEAPEWVRQALGVED